MERDIIPTVGQLIPSPVALSLLSILLRTHPYDDLDSVREEIQKGIAKELDATVQRGPHVQRIDYRVWLSQDPRDARRPIVYGYPTNYDMHMDIRRRFRTWR